jgi:hypothetical protein
VEDLQETLQDPNLPKREKQRVVDSYTKSVKKYAALVNVSLWFDVMMIPIFDP